VWGPESSFIEDNNHLAIALLMMLPIGYYLFHQATQRWLRIALVVSMGLIAVSVVGSYSRGALLAIVAVSLYLWWKSRNRLVMGLAVLPLLPVLFLAMPEGWHNRMSTITEYEQDSSATGRLNAWEYAINLANDRIMGAGFDSWSSETFARWAPDPSAVHAAHSIYFSVLADHGWIGLLLFLIIFIGAWRLAGRISRITDHLPEHRWMADLSRMLQVSLVAYAVGGAFLSMSYFDLPWHIISFLVLMRAILEKQGVQLYPKTSFAEDMARQRTGA
jgi:probable O-glycosylation ligase (exosortase A-associated)